MPPEQTQNQFFSREDQKEVKELTEKAKKDPSSVDPDQLERDLLQKLEKTAGSKRLSEKAFRDYQEARRLIKEAAQELRQVHKFFADRLKIDRVEDAATTRVGDKVDYSDRIAEEAPGLAPTPYTRQMVMAWDFDFLNKFINQPDDRVPEDLKPALWIAKGKAIDTRRNLALALSDHYHDIFPAEVNKIAEKLEERVGRAETGQSDVTMLDYVDLDDDLSDIEMYLRDRQDLMKGAGRSGGGPAFDTLRDPSLERVCADASVRAKELRRQLVAARQYMKPDERFAVENQEKATGAVARGDKQAKGWEKAAWDRKLLIVIRQQAESNGLRALALGADTGRYTEGQRKMAEAAKVAPKDRVAANRLYTQADDLFREARDIYVAAQKKKKNPRGPGEKPETPDNRLARRG